MERTRARKRGNGKEPSRKSKLSKLDSQDVVWGDKAEQKEAEETLEKMESAFSTIIGLLGDENPGRDELKKTPKRAAKALFHFTKGYEESLQSS